MAMELRLVVQEGTLGLVPERKRLVPAEVVTVEGSAEWEAYALLYVGGGYVPVRRMHLVSEDADVWFVPEGGVTCWYARMYRFRNEYEPGQFYEDMCFFDDLGRSVAWGDCLGVVAPGRLGLVLGQVQMFREMHEMCEVV